MMYCLQTKVSKELNSKLVKKCLKKDKSKRFHLKIKEYDNIKKLVEIFLINNFPYVSYVYGGFKDIHDQSLKINIPLLNHEESCYICKKRRKKIQKKGFFEKFFKKDNKSNNVSSPG
jgi:hypothetical protein